MLSRNMLTLIVVCLLGIASVANAQTKEAPSAQNVVNQYLTAWMNGDFAKMLSCVTKQQQKLITPKMLRMVYTLPFQSPKKSVPIYGLDYVITGRPANAKAVATKKLVDKISVDVLGTWIMAVQMGFMSEEANAALGQNSPVAHDPANAKRIAEYKRLLPQLAMLPPGTTDTRKGESHESESIGSSKELLAFNNVKSFPKVILHFHRYILVKEDGLWRISNALSVSKSVIPAPKSTK